MAYTKNSKSEKLLLFLVLSMLKGNKLSGCQPYVALGLLAVSIPAQ